MGTFPKFPTKTPHLSTLTLAGRPPVAQVLELTPHHFCDLPSVSYHNISSTFLSTSATHLGTTNTAFPPDSLHHIITTDRTRHNGSQEEGQEAG